MKKLNRAKYSDSSRVIETMEDYAKKGLLQKTTQWSYEKEWRLVGAGDEYIPYPKEALRSITFGAKTAPDVRDDIITLCEELGFTEVRFFQSRFEGPNLTREPL